MNGDPLWNSDPEVRRLLQLFAEQSKTKVGPDRPEADDPTLGTLARAMGGACMGAFWVAFAMVLAGILVLWLVTKIPVGASVDRDDLVKSVPAKQRVKEIACDRCEGTGKSLQDCKACLDPRQHAPRCNVCKGAGAVRLPCTHCRGTGSTVVRAPLTLGP